MRKKDFKYGFALTELLISITIMAVLSLLVVFAITKKTKKAISAPQSMTSICYKDIDGNLNQKNITTMKNKTDVELREDIEECVVDVPTNVKIGWVYLIGGGGGGGAINKEDFKYTGVSEPIKIDVSLKRDTYRPTIVDLGNVVNEKKVDNAFTIDSCTTGLGSKVSLKITDIGDGRVNYSVRNGSYYANLLDCPKKIKLTEEDSVKKDFLGFQRRINLSDAMKKAYEEAEVGAYFSNKSAEQLFKKVTDQTYSLKIVHLRSNNSFKPFVSERESCKGGFNSNTISSGEKTVCEIPERMLVYNTKYNEIYDHCKYGSGYCIDKMLTGDTNFATIKAYPNKIDYGYATRGSNGEVNRFDITEFMGRKITIKKENIGLGGFVGGNGGDTNITINGVLFKASGGAKGQSKSYNTKNDKNNLKQMTILEKTKTPNLEDGTISRYYDYGSEELNEIPGDKSGIVLPNSVCTIDSGTNNISFSTLDNYKNNKKFYSFNYGGGGGGSAPCVQYKAVKSSTLSLYTGKSASETYTNQDNEKPEYFYAPSGADSVKDSEARKGMGGAIIIKWSQI